MLRGSSHLRGLVTLVSPRLAHPITFWVNYGTTNRDPWDDDLYDVCVCACHMHYIYVYIYICVSYVSKYVYSLFHSKHVYHIKYIYTISNNGNMSRYACVMRYSMWCRLIMFHCVVLRNLNIDRVNWLYSSSTAQGGGGSFRIGNL